MFFKGGLTVYVVTACLVTAPGCGSGGRDSAVEPVIRAAVSVMPQSYFLKRIGGENVAVTVVVPPGASPATYEPSPSDMRSMSDAGVWFTVGVAFEDPWLPRFTESNPELRVVSTIEGIHRRPVGRYSVETLGAGGMSDQHEHHHESDSPDPHVWLSPELVRLQAEIMARELAAMDPDRAELYYANLRDFQLEIDSLQLSIHSLLDTLSSRSFMVFHPAWGYFADEFGLVQVPVESSGSEPSPGEMARLVDFALENRIETVFVSPQFSTSSARAIAAEIHGDVAEMDPLAPDWGDNLIRVAELLAGRGGHER